MAIYLGAGLYMLLAITATASNLFEPFSGAAILKTLPALLLGALAFVYSRSRFGGWIATGVWCGAFGDFSLADAQRSWFLAGLAAFLLGHIAYCIAFARNLHSSRGRWIVILCTCLGMAALTCTVVNRLAHVGVYGLIPPLLGYVCVMAVMMALALLHRSNSMLIAVGAVIFIVSDAHIAVNHMLLDSPRLGLTLSGYSLYYTAQFCIVTGAIREALEAAPAQAQTVQA